MKVIIVYNTATGKTRTIANKMKEILERYDHTCDIYRDKEIKKEVITNPQYFDSYDLLYLGSCTHGGQPAVTFNRFVRSIEKHDLKGKSLVCFSSSGGPDTWKGTCNKIKSNFPEMNHVGNFGGRTKKYDSSFKDFEVRVKTLN